MTDGGRWSGGGGGHESSYLLCKTGNSTIEVQTVLSM